MPVIRGDVLFRVFCLGCAMLWNRLVALTHLPSTFSVCIYFSPFMQITACLLTVITEQTHHTGNKKQCKEEGKKSLEEPKLPSTFKSSTMNQEEKILKNWVQEQPNQTERLCSPPHPLAAGHRHPNPTACFGTGHFAPRHLQCWQWRGACHREWPTWACPGEGGKRGQWKAATSTPSNTSDFIRLGRHLGRSPTKNLSCTKFNSKTNTAEVVFVCLVRVHVVNTLILGAEKLQVCSCLPPQLLGPASRSQGSPRHPSRHRASLHYLPSSVNQVMAKYCCEKIPVLKTQSQQKYNYASLTANTFRYSSSASMTEKYT